MIRASRDQGRLNPGFKPGEIEVWIPLTLYLQFLSLYLCTHYSLLLQVAVLEEVIKGMKVSFFVYSYFPFTVQEK